VNEPLHTPEQRRRNLVLGSLLGVLSLVITAAFIVVFTRNGFPKDPQEWQRLQAQRQAQGAATDAQRASP
jgi:hypothetical protein